MPPTEQAKPQLVNAALGNPIGLDPADQHGSDDIVASELVLPINREVDLQLRSLDVIHGFFVPDNAPEAERRARRHAARPLHAHSRRHLPDPLLAGLRIGPRTHAGAHARRLAVRL